MSDEMASGDVHLDVKETDASIASCSSIPSFTPKENVSLKADKCINSENGGEAAADDSSENVLIMHDKLNLQWDKVESKTNGKASNNSSGESSEKTPQVNGLKSENEDLTEQNLNNNNNRPIHLNAKGWSLSAENQNTAEKRLSTSAYTYGGKSGTFHHGLSMNSYNQRSSTNKLYNLNDSTHACQTPVGNIAGSNEHIVLLHVNPGETISFYMGDHAQLIQGPATVRMVSCNSTPPMPMPVQVPPGHMVQQIVDENGTLRHIILSPQPPVAVPVGARYSAGSNTASATTGPSGGHTPFFIYPHPSYPPPPPMQFHPHMQPGLSNHTLHNHGAHMQPQHGSSSNQGANGPGSYATPNAQTNVHKDERTQKQFYKLKKRLEARQKDGPVIYSETNLASRNNGVKRSENEKVSSEPEAAKQRSTYDSKIYELLSAVTRPNVSEVAVKSALVSWSAPNFSAELLENCSESTEDILYKLLIGDKSPEGPKKAIYSGKLLEYELSDLKPGASYYICVQAILNNVCGKFSESVVFKALITKPDPPQAPKLSSRAKTFIVLKWNAAADNGARILSYILEFDDGQEGDTFTEVFNGLQKQFKVTKLKASTCYRFRLAAENEQGKSDYSEVVCFSTSGMPPTQPSPPDISKATTNSLFLSWELRPNDDSFTLQMETEGSLHGFLPVYNGKDTFYTCVGLRRKTLYKFRLCANNEEGSSSWSQVVDFTTLPEKPLFPSKPLLKGKVHSTFLKVAWDPPKDDGGSDVTGYELEMDNGNGYMSIFSGNVLEFLCEQLQPGVTYSFQVKCTNEGGVSPYSEPCSIQTLPVVPGRCLPPTLYGKQKATYLHLKWGHPEYDGGSEILQFELEILNPDGSTRQAYKGFETDCRVAGLFPGRTYAFYVRAFNKVGHGPWSETMEIKTLAGSPDIPREVQALPRSPHSVFVSWEEPCDNGSAITEYRLESCVNDNCQTFQMANIGSLLNAEVKNLTPATSYSFHVQAVNAAGSSQFGECVSCETPPSSPGSIPSALIKSVSGASIITLSWKEPNNHGSPITSYNVEVGDVLTSVDQPEIGIEDLLSETLYRIRIQAVNSFGLGPFTSLKVSTRGLPPCPPIIECSGYSHNSLRLKWGDGKNPDFIQYTVEMLNMHTGCYSPVYQGTGHCHKASRLEEMTSYNFRIYASNTEGDGQYSDVYTFTTLKAVPPAPKAPKVNSIIETSCAIEWLPAKTIGDDVVSYKLQIGSKTSDYTVAYTGIQTNFVLRGLHPGTEYSVRVAAVRNCTDGSGELTGPFSPCSVFCTLFPVSKSTMTKNTPVFSSFTEREPLTDQQWSIIIVCGFTIFAIFVAILIQWILSHANS